MSELFHKGIKGMRWGQRNGPPYPLDKKDYSVAEKRAAGSESKKKKPNAVGEFVGTTRLNRQAQKNASLERDKRIAEEQVELYKQAGKNASQMMAKRAVQRAEKLTKKLSNSEEKTKRLISELANKGYEVDSEDYLRDAAKGKRRVATITGGAVGMLAMGPVGILVGGSVSRAGYNLLRRTLAEDLNGGEFKWDSERFDAVPTTRSRWVESKKYKVKKR